MKGLGVKTDVRVEAKHGPRRLKVQIAKKFTRGYWGSPGDFPVLFWVLKVIMQYEINQFILGLKVIMPCEINQFITNGKSE